MRNIFVVLLLIVVVMPGRAEETDAAEVAGIDGVPLMPGLVELVDETVVFDKPEGRLVLAVAEGPNRETYIKDYYRRELPGRGWVPKEEASDSLVFVRGEEQLEISIQLVREIIAPGPDAVGLQGYSQFRVSFRLSPL